MSATNIWRSINQNLNSILDKTSVASVYLTSFKDVSQVLSIGRLERGKILRKLLQCMCKIMNKYNTFMPLS